MRIEGVWDRVHGKAYGKRHSWSRGLLEIEKACFGGIMIQRRESDLPFSPPYLSMQL